MKSIDNPVIEELETLDSGYGSDDAENMTVQLAD